MTLREEVNHIAGVLNLYNLLLLNIVIVCSEMFNFTWFVDVEQDEVQTANAIFFHKINQDRGFNPHDLKCRGKMYQAT